jgi:hypothetical protein
MLQQAFNGDRYIAHTFLTLKNTFNIDTVVETGTHLGNTTVFLSSHFKNVFSIEISKPAYDVSLKKLNDLNLHPTLILGKSEDVLKDLIINNNITNNTIFYLDAHCYECPLKKELEIIRECNIKPIIAIHDFLVPNSKTLNYDTYDNQPYTYEWLKPQFDQIYNCNYNYWYNDDVFSEEIKRGIIYLVPEIKL